MPDRTASTSVARGVLALLSLGAVIAAGAPVRGTSAQGAFLHAPAVTEYTRLASDGVSILGDGRLLKPYGRSYPVARWPHGLAQSSDGACHFVACEGAGEIVTNQDREAPTLRPILAPMLPGQKHPENAGGAAISPDRKLLYWSGGDRGSVYVIELATGKLLQEISLNVSVAGQPFADSFAMDVRLSGDGRYLYCADVTNFRLAVIDTEQRKVVGSVRTGRYPYALAVQGDRVYVANIGMFEYTAVPKPADADHDPRGLTFPAFGFPSREAREGVEAEGRHVAGLGDPNAPESFSVWGVDVRQPESPRVVSRLKTGILVGAPADGGRAVGGSAPNFLAVSGDNLFVSNGNNDMVERIDTRSGKIAAVARLIPSPITARLRGVGPAGMAVSPDGSRLYVAESGINAIAVLEAKRLRVLGHIPTAWYPYRVTVSPDGKRLLCICFKGFGNGPKNPAHASTDAFAGMKGVLTILPVPSDRELSTLTRTVLECDGLIDRRDDRARMAGPLFSDRPGHPSNEIRYVVFITKENHTYDTIFDRVPGANGDPSLLRWGSHQLIAQAGQPTLEGAAVMTNHNSLARQFTISDNFYMEPEASGVGHRWLVGVQPNNFCQMTYTLGWEFEANSTAPGRRAAFGSNGSLAPEDYPEAGSMWEHLAQHGVPFRNYGEGFEFAGVQEVERTGLTGARETVNIPMSKVLYDSTCREYPLFNMNIPDQYRADLFIRDYRRLFEGGKRPFPSFVNIAICNDHGTDPRPAKGYPYRASWMADNDLALGRIVEFLSHTPYWKNMAIFVTQDDAGGEPDHVDAQRSVLLVISPWARRHYVSHRHTTIVSMHRTLYEIFGLPPLNLSDAVANDFSDCFTATPDYTPYTHTAVDARVFDPRKARNAGDPDYRRARREPSIRMDDPDEVERFARQGEGTSRRKLAQRR